jgi:hypothetical protein
MADEPKLELGPAIAFFACAVGAVVEDVRIALGHTDDLRILWVRGVIVMGCFVWAVCYGAAMQEPRYKKFLGVLAIIVSTALLWYQLTNSARPDGTRLALSTDVPSYSAGLRCFPRV